MRSWYRGSSDELLSCMKNSGLDHTFSHTSNKACNTRAVSTSAFIVSSSPPLTPSERWFSSLNIYSIDLRPILENAIEVKNCFSTAFYWALDHKYISFGRNTVYTSSGPDSNSCDRTWRYLTQISIHLIIVEFISNEWSIIYELLYNSWIRS